MCGICGVLNFDGAEVDPVRIRQMTDSLRHRGPDGTGQYIDREVGFGHARLSILDLPGGGQPMRNEDQTIWITFNGEAFNYIELREELIKKGHRFSTRSDTEVTLHLYEEEGESCVERLNGQWAFAIWDKPRRKLFLSRDRLGVRPLFYTQTAGSFLFASEIKALFTQPEVTRELDLNGLDQIFTFWFTLPPRTAFRDIHQLAPGHSLAVEDGRVRVCRYWRPDFPMETEGNRNEGRLREELVELLGDAARLRLRSDVPVGAYLSGGLDSAVVAGLAKQTVGHGLQTFSISFDDAEFDESEHQKQASRHLGTRHTDVRCSYADIAGVFPDVIWHTEQPVLRTAPAPMFLLSKLVRDSGFKVVLTGEGADEVMGGYDIFQETKIREFWGRHPESAWRPLLLKRLYPYMNGIQRQHPSYLARFFHVTDADLRNPHFSHLPRWELTSSLKTFLSLPARVGPENSAIAVLNEILPARYLSWPPFRRAEYLETMHLLPGYILSSQGDRMAMAHSVEGRYPFLDHRVVEFGARLPATLKMKVLNQKYLLKAAAKNLVPEAIRIRPKQPYRAPDGRSFFGSGQPYVKEMLSESNVRKDGVFDPVRVTQLVNKFSNGNVVGVRDNMALVGILSTEILLDRLVSRREAAVS